MKLPLFPAVAGATALRWFSHGLGCEPWALKGVDFFARQRIFDGSKARHRLGYEPKVPLRETIRNTLAWYRSAGRL